MKREPDVFTQERNAEDTGKVLKFTYIEQRPIGNCQ